MQISAEYVPLFYLLFGLFMASGAAWGIWGFFKARAGMDQFMRRMEAEAGVHREQPDSLQPKWPEEGFPRLQLPAYVTSWSGQRFQAQMAIGTGERQNPELPWLWFESDFRYPIGRLPVGTVTVISSRHKVGLSFRYAEGEESAAVSVDGRPLGSLRVDVHQAPYFLANVELYEPAGAHIGRWQNVPVSSGPIINDLPAAPTYGEVTVEGDQIAEMLVFFPKRWKKGGFQSVMDRLHLFIIPDPRHPDRDKPLLRNVSPELSEEQHAWLLALLGLQVHKLSFKVPGKKV